MAASVQISIPLSQPYSPPSNQISISPSQDTSPTPLVPSQLSGNDVVNIIIAISVLVGVILGKSPKSK